jgi:L-aspartate oxidase
MKEDIYDFLVIGSGAAGLYFSILASEHGKVLLLTKNSLRESNTYYAQGGIASVEKDTDSFEEHIRDTLTAGDELCNPKAVETIVNEGPDIIHDLIRRGVKFTKDENKSEYSLHREGGHSESRVFHFKDITGRELIRALTKNVSENKNITIFENMMSVDLLTEHQKELEPEDLKNATCYGIYAYDLKKQQIRKILSRSTILATGGSGQVYMHTSNPAVATGDGLAMAYRAGATISNLEFYQFHPTTLYTEKEKESSFLISEAVRGFGGELKTKDGKKFMHKYHPLKSLAPRDVVARAIDTEMKKRGDDFVYLDVSNFPAKKIITSFPNIYHKCLEEGIDITKEMIPVVPAAHYQCGGIETDLHGKTDIKGLYAIGEVAQNGVHGANRLASNSLLDALVFAKISSGSVQKYISKNMTDFTGIKDWEYYHTERPLEKVVVSYLRNTIKRLVSEFVGIVRSDERLKMAQKMVELMAWQARDYYMQTTLSKETIELRNIADVASLMVRFASFRKESRGLHFNIDHPHKDNLNWQKNSRIRNTGRRSKGEISR